MACEVTKKALLGLRPNRHWVRQVADWLSAGALDFGKVQAAAAAGSAVLQEALASVGIEVEPVAVENEKDLVVLGRELQRVAPLAQAALAAALGRRLGDLVADEDGELCWAARQVQLLLVDEGAAPRMAGFQAAQARIVRRMETAAARLKALKELEVVLSPDDWERPRTFVDETWNEQLAANDGRPINPFDEDDDPRLEAITAAEEHLRACELAQRVLAAVHDVEGLASLGWALTAAADALDLDPAAELQLVTRWARHWLASWAVSPR